jgi:phospholipase C
MVGFLAVCALLLGALTFDVPPLLSNLALVAPHASPPAHHDVSAAKVAQARAKIKHVVFVLLENHSFDNIYGRFPGADGATTARSGTQTIPLLHAPPFYWHDINHEYSDANNAIDKGKMDGFSLEGGADMNGDRMAYQQCTQSASALPRWPIRCSGRTSPGPITPPRPPTWATSSRRSTRFPAFDRPRCGARV